MISKNYPAIILLCVFFGISCSNKKLANRSGKNEKKKHMRWNLSAAEVRQAQAKHEETKKQQ